MDDLLALVAAKKREVSAIRAEKQSLRDKYLRREQVEQILDQRQPEIAAGSEQTPAKKRRLEHEDRRPSSQHAEHHADSTQHKQPKLKPKLKQAEDVVELSWLQLTRRLRELGQPIALFGEDSGARMTRLRAAEHDAVNQRDEALDDRQETRNVFVGRNQEAKEQEQAAEEAAEEQAEQAQQAHKSVGGGKAADADVDADDEADDEVRIHRFLKGMLRRWESDLGQRADAVKRTAQGKQAAKTMKQCKDYIRPLFRLCKRHQVPRDILPNLVEIVRFCEQGEFVQAHDAYIRLAIGNAAWPIGVTMVGIHERTGREKINANKQAHVMNNEAQRKYITSVKRLISYAQSISHALPSKKVM